MSNEAANHPHRISLETAIAMTTRYRAQKDTILAPGLPGRDLLPISETFDRAAFDGLLAQPGCTGVRIYYGMNESLQLRAVIVGVNAKDEDILPTQTAPDAEILDISKLCPPVCAPASPLNTDISL
jgi:hypothetical protein